nr:heterogeneous nuclear ribonucleoprotein A1-like [Salvelinus alpinus]
MGEGAWEWGYGAEGAWASGGMGGDMGEGHGDVGIMGEGAWELGDAERGYMERGHGSGDMGGEAWERENGVGTWGGLGGQAVGTWGRENGKRDMGWGTMGEGTWNGERREEWGHGRMGTWGGEWERATGTGMGGWERAGEVNGVRAWDVGTWDGKGVRDWEMEWKGLEWAHGRRGGDGLRDGW